jgi:hypothetical protein
MIILSTITKNTFMKYIGKPFFGWNNISKEKEKISGNLKDNGQFIVNKSVLKNSNLKLSKNLNNKSIKNPVKNSSTCPGSKVGIENRNTNIGKNGGKVYCYLNSLMQMLYCIDELRKNTLLNRFANLLSRKNIFLKSVFSLLSGNNKYISAKTIVPIYKKMYSGKNILNYNDPIEFLEFTKNEINKINNDIITINLNRNSLDFALSELNKNTSIDYKKYLFINIEKIGNSGTTTVLNFINKNASINKELTINHKIKYKLLGAIFWSEDSHYTFASYDDKGHVCRYYDDEKIYGSLLENITLEKNAKLLLYKEVSTK